MILSKVLQVLDYFWEKLLGLLSPLVPYLKIGGCIAVICLIMGFAIIKLKNRAVAVFFSTLLSCFLMFPLVNSINEYIVNYELREVQEEINEQNIQAELLRKENQVRVLEKEILEKEKERIKLEIENDHLSKSKALLESAKISLTNFQTIAELALTSANFKHTLVKKEPVSPLKEGWGLLADYYYDEVLVVINYDFNAKFGVDLKEVKVEKGPNGSVVVSQIKPKYIGSEKFERLPIVKEIRKLDFKYGVPYRITRRNENHQLLIAENRANQYELEFQRRISDGLELAFMDDAIVQLAQNFIKIVLAPIYGDKIEFSDKSNLEGLPLLAFIEEELKLSDEEMYNNLKISENILINISSLEDKKTEIEAELGVIEVNSPEIEDIEMEAVEIKIDDI